MPRWAVSLDTRVDVAHPDVVSLAAQADALARVINRIPIPPGVRQRLDALNILRAVRGTTGIEGSDLTEGEVREVTNRAVLRPGLRQIRLQASMAVWGSRQVLLRALKTAVARKTCAG